MATAQRWVKVGYAHRGQEEPDQPDNSYDPDSYRPSETQWSWSAGFDDVTLVPEYSSPRVSGASHPTSRFVHEGTSLAGSPFGAPFPPDAWSMDEAIPTGWPGGAMVADPYDVVELTVYFRPEPFAAWDDYLGSWYREGRGRVAGFLPRVVIWKFASYLPAVAPGFGPQWYYYPPQAEYDTWDSDWEQPPGYRPDDIYVDHKNMVHPSLPGPWAPWVHQVGYAYDSVGSKFIFNSYLNGGHWDSDMPGRTPEKVYYVFYMDGMFAEYSDFWATLHWNPGPTPPEHIVPPTPRMEQVRVGWDFKVLGD